MRVVVVGAGIVGAACAYFAAEAGHEVTIVDRGAVGAGTTSRGEGNVLVSDKGPGAELDLALASRRLWQQLGDRLGGESFELEAKGGLVVATSPEAATALQDFAATQRAAGVEAEFVADPTRLEPHIAPGLPGAVLYPQDAQVQPVLAAVALLRSAVARGAVLVDDEVTAGEVDSAGRLVGVRTRGGRSLPADAVVNAAGTWGAQVSERLGAPVPVLPRRGFVLVSEPLPPMVRRKVYSADYVANVASSDEGLETSCVVEGTRGGTVLVGASRERVGFDARMSPEVVALLADRAVRLFPFLRDVRLMRVYRGFRPYCPDHLPVVGPDPRVPGLLHACGHEGAGIGLAPATGALVAAHLEGRPVEGVDPTVHGGLLPDRFVTEETR